MKRIVSICFYILGSLVMLTLALDASIYVDTYRFIYNSLENMPQAEAVIIPGAAVLRNGTLSPIFRDRVDAAIRLYEAGKVSKILVSGDNSTVTYNEVNPVRVYLLQKGLPDEDIFLDHAGFDTYSTMYRAKSVFGVTSAIVATQSFHLPRSVFLARSLGIKAYGLNADVGHILLRNYLREIAADVNAVYELLRHRVPKYLGDSIPIAGDGTLYP